jgi:hypothetical protein
MPHVENEDNRATKTKKQTRESGEGWRAPIPQPNQDKEAYKREWRRLEGPYHRARHVDVEDGVTTIPPIAGRHSHRHKHNFGDRLTRHPRVRKHTRRQTNTHKRERNDATQNTKSRQHASYMGRSRSSAAVWTKGLTDHRNIGLHKTRSEMEPQTHRAGGNKGPTQNTAGVP